MGNLLLGAGLALAIATAAILGWVKITKYVDKYYRDNNENRA
jgi:hypothetical protein